MKTVTSLIIISIFYVNNGFSTTHIITNSGFTFSPNNLTINLGDTINFDLAPTHNALEVSQATWDANGNTSNGGFNVQFGGGTFIPQEGRIYYYVCSIHSSFGMKGTITVNPVTSATTDENNSPKVFMLNQNYPNPFNPSTIISFSVPEPTEISLKVYNLLGVEIQTLINGIFNAGIYEIPWDASNISAGIYFYKLQAQKLIIGKAEIFSETKRLMLIK